MMKEIETLNELTRRIPDLAGCADAMEEAGKRIVETYHRGGTVFTCGNGGSAADSDHIVGELMKGFLKRRPIPAEDRAKLTARYPDGDTLADNLQVGLPAISLHSQSALLTAFANDVDASMMYAQTLYAMGKPGDLLIAISTSGNSANVVNAARIAAVMGVEVVALVGEKACKLDDVANTVVHVPQTETYRVQELHLPVYHWLCAYVEQELCGNE